MPDDKKKISVILNMDLIRKIEDLGLTQTKAVTEALDYYFSEDKQLIESYKMQILEQKEKIIGLEARLSEFEFIKEELNKVHEEHKTHVLQVQALINQTGDKIRLLENKTVNKKWWRFW
jgi:uncharacterized coiled-coil protein SlyX